ncbi:unnamed protein product [Allacma fusca]|uniref:DUF4789 domain-containing protein n=1 Tax=Allacma fusca TaxID=39272 RepID=A0A8J2KSY1_9HEXA|nr:unnamed protein product [Allacma fusca]
MKYIFLPAVSLVLLIFGLAEAQRLTRRRTTTTSTTAAPVSTIAEREANLLHREESFNAREAKFREREVNLTLREDSLRLREQMISVREDNIKIRELKGDDAPPATTPAPDYSLVRKDVRTEKFVDIGTTDSCSENMRFFAIPGSKTDGMCDCDYHQCNRPLLYSKAYDQCFWAWSQGPCESGEWYTYNDTLHPVCVKNKCPESGALRSSKYYFQDPDDGECYETTTKGYCQNVGETLMATSDDPFPKCRSHTLCFPLSNPPQQECIAGNRRHLDGFCE